MHQIVSYILVLFAGWTVSAHICVLMGLNLHALLMLSPIIIGTFLTIYRLVLSRESRESGHPNRPRSYDQAAPRIEIIRVTAPSAVLLAIIALYWSWEAYWLIAILILISTLVSRNRDEPLYVRDDEPKHYRYDTPIVISLVVVSILTAYAVSRSDLDDSFYVAVAAYSSANPTNALLSGDPMLGETDIPLIFPSYYFSSFELLSGALAYLFQVPAMDLYYIYLLPVWVVAAVLVTFLLTRQMIPNHWLFAGIIALLLTLLLGEMHRSPANFAFVRIFQGKAVFLSVIVPAIFYFTARYFSHRGTRTDLWLLACCQLASIGASNFGMLMGPIAGLGALASNLPLVATRGIRTASAALAVISIPLPYLIAVALQTNVSALVGFGSESPARVWTSVFGANQQYLVSILMLVGPILARDTLSRWRMTIPALLLIGVYLNPGLGELISQYITTPPVYWRVVWSFPITILCSISACMLVVEVTDKSRFTFPTAVLAAVVLVLAAFSLSHHTLRSENIGADGGFATWKIPLPDLVVAETAMRFSEAGGTLLAPDEIAGVISRFEHRPALVSTRGLYLHLIKPLVSEEEYFPRKTLYDFVTGQLSMKDEEVRRAIKVLNVSTIVVRNGPEVQEVFNLLTSDGFVLRAKVYDYSIWAK